MGSKKLIVIYLDIDGVLLPHPPVVNSRCAVCKELFSSEVEWCQTDEELELDFGSKGIVCSKCVPPQYKLTKTFPDRCVSALKKTLSAVDGVGSPLLVLSSTWRCHSGAKEELKSLFYEKDIPWSGDETDPTFHGSRQEEILRDWRSRAVDNADFLIIDDDEDVWTNARGLEAVEGRIIKCISQCGLCWSDAEETITGKGWIS